MLRNRAQYALRRIITRAKVDLNVAVGGFSKDEYQNLKYLFVDKEDTRVGVESLGEDAFFLNKTAERYDAYGIADGVGGWRRQGVDPSIFSSTLMRECLLASVHVNSGAQTAKTVCPNFVMTNAVEAMKSTHKESGYQLLGSSTALTMVIDKDEHSAAISNLGDSGFVHIRDGTILSRSTEQTHFFNCPFQLSLPTPGQKSIIDSPADADSYNLHDIRASDIILLGTDGLFDNVPDNVLLECLAGLESASMGDKLVQLARVCLTFALDEKFVSPFAQMARGHGYANECGGKLDDLTILITHFEDAE